jgi:phage-related protein
MGAAPVTKKVEPLAGRPAKRSAPESVPSHEPAAGRAGSFPVYLRTVANAAAPEATSAAGKPLEPALRARFEARFLRDFSAVRVHENAESKLSSTSPNANAVTVGSDIYFASGAYAPGTSAGAELLAHELTHVLQQEGAEGPAGARVGNYADRFELEARRNARAVSEGGTLQVRERGERTGPQPDEEGPGFFMRLLLEFFPEIKPILERGLMNWLEDQVGDAIKVIVDRLLAPVRAVRGIVESLTTHFGQLVDWVKKAAASVARGDCSVLHEAVDFIEQAVAGLVSPVLDKIKELGRKIGDFFSGLWDTYGAPIWNKMKEVGGAAWGKIQDFGHWIWDKTARLRSLLSRAWTWFKNLLGIGEGPEGQNGLLQWVEEKAEKAWDYLKAKIEPIKKPLLVLGGILVMLSPAGPVIAVGLAVGGVIEGVRAIKRYLATKNGVVSAREALRTIVLPKLIGVVRGFSKLLADKANGLLEALRRAHAAVTSAVAAAEQSIFSFLADLLQFVADRIDDLVKWGNQVVADFLGWIERVTAGFAGFLERVLSALDEIGAVLRDLLKLPVLLAGKVWNAIPECIRDPFVDFFGVQILGRIAVFQALAGTKEAWDKTKAEVALIIKEFFLDFDLMGAMKRAFRLLLTALDVPVELLVAVMDKVVAAWDTIKEQPVAFVKNLLSTIKLAFKGFFKNIGRHLLNGVTGWLTAQLKGTNVVLPKNWTDLGEIFGFVASVLGVSFQHVMERLQKKVSPERFALIQKVVRGATVAWDWLKLLLTGDFAGLWQKIQQKLSDLKNAVLSAVVSWITSQFVESAEQQLVATADPTGISEVVVVLIDIYRTIKTVVQYMRTILTAVNNMLDAVLGIAKGVLQPAADLVESALDKAMPAVIGFLANLAGLGDLAADIKEALTDIRAKVDEAIDWLIDQALAMVDAVVDAVKGAIASVKAWWLERRPVQVGDEEHTLTFHGAEENAELYMESTPMPLEEFLKNHPKGDKTKRDQVIDLAAQIKKTKDDKSFGQSAGADIAKWMGQIADLLDALYADEAQPATQIVDNKEQDISVGGGKCTAGKTVEAKPLTFRPPSAGGWTGSEPMDESLFWKAVNRRSGEYIRGHLLNHHLFGPGRDHNLTPIARQANTQMSAQVEEKAKDLVLNQHKVLNYKVVITYPSTNSGLRTHIPEENLLATVITATYQEMVLKPGGTANNAGDWVLTGAVLGGPIANNLPPDTDPGTGRRILTRVNLNLRTQDFTGKNAARASELLEAFEEAPGIGPANAKALAKANRFNKYEDFRSELGMSAASLADLRADGRFRLKGVTTLDDDLVWA